MTADGEKIHKLINLVSNQAIKVHIEYQRAYVNPLSRKAQSFNFRFNCLFCAHCITDSEKRKICLHFLCRNFQFHKSILKACNLPNDLWTENIYTRLLSIIKLPVAEAR